MPKSREQKQKEAIERKRAGIKTDRTIYLERQVGGTVYNFHVEHHGKDEANRQAEIAKKAFHKRCEEAKVDPHGNDLPPEEYVFKTNSHQRKSLERLAHRRLANPHVDAVDS